MLSVTRFPSLEGNSLRLCTLKYRPMRRTTTKASSLFPALGAVNRRRVTVPPHPEYLSGGRKIRVAFRESATIPVTNESSMWKSLIPLTLSVIFLRYATVRKYGQPTTYVGKYSPGYIIFLADIRIVVKIPEWNLAQPHLLRPGTRAESFLEETHRPILQSRPTILRFHKIFND